MNIPSHHPRAESLWIREKLVKAYRKGILAATGLIAHGRGECFDYIIGEKTRPFALKAERAGVAALLLAERPVISVNGNAAALCARGLVELTRLVNAKVEVNLFHRTLRRERAIANLLRKEGLNKIYGVGGNAYATIPQISSLRCKVDPRGLLSADTVLLSLEDGDRTMAYRGLGKKVVAIDLNPLSRTALWASITIIDNITRAIPNMIQIARVLRSESRFILKETLGDYDNAQILKDAVNFINARLKTFSENEIFDYGTLGADVKVILRPIQTNPM